jgi:hypothetical protein
MDGFIGPPWDYVADAVTDPLSALLVSGETRSGVSVVSPTAIGPEDLLGAWRAVA